MKDLTRYRLCAGIPAPPAAKLLYCYLLDISDDKSGVVKSVKHIAKGVGLSRSATGRNLHRLKRLGLIKISPRYTEDGGRLANQYILM